MVKRNFKVIIPSKGRSAIIAKHPLLKYALVACPESQADAYREEGANVVPRPDSLVGLYAARQWILDTLWDESEPFIFLLDDDLIHLDYLFTRHPTISTDPDYMMAVIAAAAQPAIDSGAGLFGFSHTNRPQERKCNVPFRLRAWLNGSGLGIIDRSLSFDKVLRVRGDIDISLQNLAQNRIVWQDVRWCFVSSRWDTPGGVTAVRTTEVQAEALEYLQTKWGSGIVTATPNSRKTGEGVKLHIN